MRDHSRREYRVRDHPHRAEASSDRRCYRWIVDATIGPPRETSRRACPTNRLGISPALRTSALSWIYSAHEEFFSPFNATRTGTFAFADLETFLTSARWYKRGYLTRIWMMAVKDPQRS